MASPAIKLFALPQQLIYYSVCAILVNFSLIILPFELSEEIIRASSSATISIFLSSQSEVLNLFRISGPNS